MSQAEELLDSLAIEVGTETEPHIVIGRDRRIVVPDELKRIAVQYDHNIETVTFDCPRYWDGLDMSAMNILVKYIRPDRVTGIYCCDNITTSSNSDTMSFDWTINKKVTEVVGNLSFLVCIKNSANGNDINHWNSELNDEMYISEGLECPDTLVADGLKTYDNAFAYNTDLETIPWVDTSKSVSFVNTFLGCSSLTVIPSIDTSKGRTFNGMLKDCISLSEFPSFDLSNAISTFEMYNGCRSITKVEKIYAPMCTMAHYMFFKCTSLETINTFEMPKCINIEGAFYSCLNLKTLPLLKVGERTSFSKTFFYCEELVSVSFVKESISKNISFAQSSKLSDASIKSIIDGLKPTTSDNVLKITFHTDVVNKISNNQELLDIISNKNWRIA